MGGGKGPGIDCSRMFVSVCACVHACLSSLVPRPSASSAPCALRVIIKCGGGKTEAEGLEEFIT